MSINKFYDNSPIRLVFQSARIIDEVNIFKNTSTSLVNKNVTAEKSPIATTQTNSDLEFSTDAFATQNDFLNARSNSLSEPIIKQADNKLFMTLVAKKMEQPLK